MPVTSIHLATANPIQAPSSGAKTSKLDGKVTSLALKAIRAFVDPVIGAYENDLGSLSRSGRLLVPKDSEKNQPDSEAIYDGL